ncbi:Crp/Fnr family transcriptional regulator [Thiohalophilus sp.]|uniref:Crp/Fnr family transcriptional regulator n=1 Tax=Thiohalophilus sp. TaxID=3028392 RepID=UPI003975B236
MLKTEERDPESPLNEQGQLQTELSKLGFLDGEILADQPRLLESISQVTYQSGEVIYHGGEGSHLLFLVRQGRLKLISHLPNGRSRIVRLHKRGSLIGMEGLMGDEHEHTAIAIDEVAIYKIPHHIFQQWKEDEPRLYNRLLEHWHEYLNYADTWITEFSTGSVKGRVARLLRFLADFESETGPHVVELLTTDEMAEILGVTAESVSRVIAEFKRESVLDPIENNSESLFTCDLETLEQLSRE